MRRHWSGRVMMPQKAWNKKRERQYEHIKESQEKRGVSEDRAEEIAARTVNKNRAQAGESKSLLTMGFQAACRVGWVAG
jgi:hypothetical protein